MGALLALTGAVYYWGYRDVDTRHHRETQLKDARESPKWLVIFAPDQFHRARPEEKVQKKLPG